MIQILQQVRDISVATKSRFSKLQIIIRKSWQQSTSHPKPFLNCRDEELCAALEVELDFGDMRFNPKDSLKLLAQIAFIFLMDSIGLKA